jgi:hypothetical protein
MCIKCAQYDALTPLINAGEAEEALHIIQDLPGGRFKAIFEARFEENDLMIHGLRTYRKTSVIEQIFSGCYDDEDPSSEILIEGPRWYGKAWSEGDSTRVFLRYEEPTILEMALHNIFDKFFPPA